MLRQYQVGVVRDTVEPLGWKHEPTGAPWERSRYNGRWVVPVRKF
jgi:hypothetical protein